LKKKHAEDRQTVQNLEGYISSLEKEVQKNREEHEVCKGPASNLNLYTYSPPANALRHGMSHPQSHQKKGIPKE